MAKKKYAECKLLKVYLEAEEYAALLVEANGAQETLSHYARMILTGVSNVQQAPVAAEAVRGQGRARKPAKRELRGVPGTEEGREDVSVSVSVLPEVAHRASHEPADAVEETDFDRVVSGRTDPYDEIVARRSGHPVGCDCFYICAKMRKMFKEA